MNLSPDSRYRRTEHPGQKPGFSPERVVNRYQLELLKPEVVANQASDRLDSLN